MIWADRVALVWALIVWGFVILTGHPEPPYSVAALIATVVPWLLLRALDFIFMGSIRRNSSAR